MSLIKEISAKTLYVANEKLLQTIFNYPPQLPTKSSSHFNRILLIHQIIKDDLTGTCTVVDSTHAQSEIASIETVAKSLKELENIIFGENTKTYDTSIAGCLDSTEYILAKLEGKQNTCIIL
jgi:hypothetical protein